MGRQVEIHKQQQSQYFDVLRSGRILPSDSASEAEPLTDVAHALLQYLPSHAFFLGCDRLDL
jgi:hypothetical protein